MSEWINTTLGEISIDNRGYYGIGASATELSEDLYTYLRITDINDDGTLNKRDMKSVDDDNASKYLLEPNDIVFARTGNSTGRSYFYDGTDGELVFAGFLIKFSLDSNKVNPKYMKYYTMSKEYKGWVKSFNAGSTRGNINATTYANMEITLPPRVIQDNLVSVLSSLDDKIENNRKTAEKLEEIAQAIFKRWYSDNYSSLNMVKIKDLEIYTSDYVANGSFASLKENVTLINDKEDYALFIRNTDLKNNFTKKVYVNKHSYNFLDKTKLFGNEIIISNVGDVGSVHRCPNFKIPMTLGNNVIMLNSKYNLYLYLLFKSYIGKSMLHSITSGSVQMKFNKTDFRNLEILFPNEETVMKFETSIRKIYDLYDNNNSEINQLIATRDALLPKLMSGEMEI